MTHYQTFFLCGKEWKNAAAFIDLMKWITPLLEPYISVDSFFGEGPKCVLTVVKRSDYGKRRPSFIGDYFKYAKPLEQDDLESLSVIAGTGLQMHLTVEFAQMSASGTSGSESTATEVPDSIKIVSLSLESTLWKTCQESLIAGELSDRWTRLFTTSGALYGFSTATDLPRTSNTDLIGPERSPLQAYDSPGRIALQPGDQIPQYPRIRDFDYAKFVEGVCRVNYISNTQLESSGARYRILAASGDLRAQVLKDPEGTEVGIAVELENDSSATKTHCAELFGNLLWKPVQFYSVKASDIPRSIP
ncbi:MAG TPA: hypothetical protein VJP02_25710 [Candidatus Sulfotelmatobacter sp.]|nr:hypothetical protein [Candidatus Sulfotelmatobacter sp.]